MALLTNPMTADLQSRIQNSSFGSPDYLQGFTGTMPGYQQNMLANNFQPGLITRDFSGAGPAIDGSGIPNYLSYTPGVFTPPALQQPNPLAGLQGSINQFLPQMGGGGGDADPNRQKGVFSGKYETFGGKMFSFDEYGVPTEVEATPFTSPIINFLAGLSGSLPGEEERRFNQLTDAQKKQVIGFTDGKYDVDTNYTRDFINKKRISNLSEKDQKRLSMTDKQRGIKSYKSDPSKNNQKNEREGREFGGSGKGGYSRGAPDSGNWGR